MRNSPYRQLITQIGSAIRCSSPVEFILTLTYRCKSDMLRHMRTTINLPDDLILQAKKAALDADTTLTEIIANALREALSNPRRNSVNRKADLTAYVSGKGGLQPGVDLDDTSALLDLMDG